MVLYKTLYYYNIFKKKFQNKRFNFLFQSSLILIIKIYNRFIWKNSLLVTIQ